MSLFDFINKNRKQNSNKQYAQILNGFSPIFSLFGENIYCSDVVQQAISCVTTEMTKLTPQHIRQSENDEIPLNSTIQRLLNEPNERMTQSDFIEKVFWSLFLHYNSFIIPTYNTSIDSDGNKVKTYTGLYPVQPTQVDFIQDASDNLFIKLKFANNYETELRYSDVIHIKYRYSVNEYMGGDITGRPDNKAILKTLELNDILLQGVAKALKSSFSINGVIKYNTLMDDGKMDENIQKIEEKLKNNESGFLPLDIKGEFIPLQNEIQLVDDKTLKFIDDKILRNFGVPLAILTGDYTKSQYDAFYQKTLEPLIKRTSEAFSRVLFTDREKSFGNRIKFYPHELIFMDTSQKLEMIRLLGDSGTMYENEKRVAFGLRPDPALAGIRMMSLNYINSNDAEKYQVGNVQEDDSNNNGGVNNE